MATAVSLSRDLAWTAKYLQNKTWRTSRTMGVDSGEPRLYDLLPDLDEAIAQGLSFFFSASNI